MPDPADAGASTLEAVRPFLYSPALPGSGGAVAGAGPPGAGSEWVSSGAVADQTKKAYEKGLSEGEQRARVESEKSNADLRSRQIADVLRSFSQERQDYFGRVEAEVVSLSLSIARKILHRESQIDPLVLTGVVHVALQKLNSETRVRLRAHGDDVPFWKEYFKHSKDLSLAVEVLGDPSLTRGECMLETDFGTTQISLDTQLKEIEQGFLDLLERRPKEEGERT